MAPYPFKTPFGIQYQNMEVQIDEAVCKQISDATDGKYFRATDNRKLKEIYDEIDKLEKQNRSDRVQKIQRRIFPICIGSGNISDT